MKVVHYCPTRYAQARVLDRSVGCCADRRAEGVHGEYRAHARDLDARHHADVADPERRPILTRLSTYPRVRGLAIGAFAETSADVRLLLRETAEAAAARFWRDAGATSATAAQSVYMSVCRRRWGAEFALQGARMRIARAYLVAGQAEPAPRDPRGGGFDPGDAAAFAAASAPSLFRASRRARAGSPRAAAELLRPPARCAHDFGRAPPARTDGTGVVSRCLRVGGVPCEWVRGAMCQRWSNLTA